MTIEGLKLAGFDIESTGPNPLKDRIVTANLTYAEVVDGELKVTGSQSWLLDPEIEIPAEAAAIHGISTEQAQADGGDYEEGVFEIADSIASANKDGRTVVIFNANFDLTMLASEYRRVSGNDAPLPPDLIVDPYVIDKGVDKFRKGSRKLVDVARHYGIELVGAHTAEGDVAATIQLAVKVLQIPKVAAKFPDEIMATQVLSYRLQQEGLAEYWRKKASRMQNTDPEEAAELRERADGVRTDWPVAM
ncbi:putative DNA polymerase III subunit epsilon [Rhodococcus phage E3]|uniref:putative DNA polymerase III subunit epsilon n=1 Tax=Rhodococcus phage E3 TaxID=1007869 RepID=UPI0002C6ADC4|nr:putative DNA polymerase III subunit epsilon [Rhodococcus phage E3]AEQ21104.1 putative DNA polymerase III subunit epsilon [Rhodococcus phage E3]